jgi:hypothetical protein
LIKWCINGGSMVDKWWMEGKQEKSVATLSPQACATFRRTLMSLYVRTLA